MIDCICGKQRSQLQPTAAAESSAAPSFEKKGAFPAHPGKRRDKDLLWGFSLSSVFIIQFFKSQRQGTGMLDVGVVGAVLPSSPVPHPNK